MVYISDADVRRLWTVANELAEFDDEARLAVEIRRSTVHLVDADLVIAHEFDPAVRVCRLDYWPHAGAGVPTIDGPTGLILSRHPLVVNHLDNGFPQPSRLSDHISVRAWTSTDVYREVVAPLGAVYQFSVPLYARDPNIVWGLTLNRARHDFSDRDRDLLTLAQPAFSVIARRLHAVDRFAPPDGSAADGGMLTRRERAVLALLASGRTTAAIGRALAISPRTARKHIENLYAKLLVHDRVSAVTRAQQLGLLPHGSPDPADHSPPGR
jgi:DNA-binding CsgD family transcriptional regulator